MGARLMAIVAEGERGRVYLPPTEAMEAVARQAEPEWKPDVEFFQQALGFRVGNYGMTKWSDLFTSRQLVALTTFSDLVQEARERVKTRRPRRRRFRWMTRGPCSDGGTGADRLRRCGGGVPGVRVSQRWPIGNHSSVRWDPTPTEWQSRNTFGGKRSR